MNKKIVIKIKVIYEFGEFIDDFGQFKEENIKKLVKIATKKNMPCLSFINLPNDSYFNELQCKDIKKELHILNKYNELDKNLLDSIEKAVDLAIEKEAFVKFEVTEI